MKRQTIISDCENYRYSLWREWDLFDSRYVLFVLLNPSTADGVNDDPTVTRCINYAKSWGYGALCIANLFAFRARHPKVMKQATDPVGPENDYYLNYLSSEASIIVAGWGANGGHLERDKQVLSLFPNIHALELTNDGLPGHPLFLEKILRPIPLHQLLLDRARIHAAV